ALASEHILVHAHPTPWDQVHKQVTMGVPALVGQPPRMGLSSEVRRHSRVEYPMMLVRFNLKIQTYR
ncbi:hypothetical protein Tco_1533822, partial [Tanacetum coccineum]